MSRKGLVYGAIYVGVLFTVPDLGVLGIRFIGGIFKGAFAGVASSIDINIWSMVKDFLKGVLA